MKWKTVDSWLTDHAWLGTRPSPAASSMSDSIVGLIGRCLAERAPRIHWIAERISEKSQITVSSDAADHRSIVLSHLQIPLSQLDSLRLQCRRAHLPPTTIHQPSLVGAFDRIAGAGQDVSSVEEEVSGGV